jgi:pimeloyl-ACP methyl ester carboxylesterase
MSDGPTYSQTYGQIHCRTLNINGYRIYTCTCGAGEPVLFLHGFAVSCDYWMPTLAYVGARGYYAIAIDILGFGRSERPDNAPYSLQFFADIFAGVLDALGIERAAVIGHSFGGKLAIAMALAHPDRVRRLIPMDADGFLPPTSSPLMRKIVIHPKLAEGLLWLVGREFVIKKQLTMSFYRPEEYVTPDLIRRARDALLLPENRRSLVAISRHGAKIDLHTSGMRTRLHEIQCPTIVMWGENDRIFPLACAEAAHREIPVSRLVTFPQCGHFPHLEATRSFYGVLLGFLAQP